VNVVNKRRVLTLREYEPAAIGEVWDPDRKTVPSRLVSELERLQGISGKEIFALSRRTIKAQQYVGTVGLNGYTIDILPKVDQDDAATRANLMQMLQVAGLVPSVAAGVAGLDASGPTLIDAFMHLYVQRLALE